MENKNVKVSIIIPLYNKEDYLEETLNCLINQSYQELEILIIDDCSTDKSVEIAAAKAKKDERIVLIQNELNQGGNACRNIGLRQATGDWILFFDADDLLTNSCVEHRVRQIDEDTDALISAMGTFIQSPGDNPGYDWIPHLNQMTERFLSHQLPWTIMQPIWRRSFIIQFDGFNEAYQRLQDVELHTRLLINGARIKLSKETTPDCFYRVVEGRHSTSKFGFFSKWVFSARLYYEDFKETPGINSKKLLNGTLIETLSQLLHACKQGHLTRKEALHLYNDLCALPIGSIDLFFLKSYFNVQLLSPIHIPGLKKTFRFLLKTL